MGTQARERARDIRRAREIAEQQRRKRARVLKIGAVIIGGLVLAIVISLIVSASRTNPPAGTTSDKPLIVPAAAAPNGSFTVGSAIAPVRLELYLDYMCPYCGRFERANGGEIQRLVGDGTVKVELHPLSFLDRMSSGSRYSTRTANAVTTVAEKAPDKVLAFNQALFDKQPAEGSAGLTNDQVAAIAIGAGVPPDVVNAFGAGTYEPWVLQATAAAFDSGITGTPTVKINGTVYQGDLYTAGPLTQAIIAAKGR